jgi:predicted lipoprotein with Yx(FWY)xxD motif
VVKDASLGDILVDGAGLTLYKWASDSPGKSNCDASCMAIWPPLLAQGALAPAASLNTGDFGVTQTTDGRSMVTYKGLPLYYYVGDKNPGDTKGNLLDIGGIWTVVAP